VGGDAVSGKVRVTALLPITVIYDRPVARKDAQAHALRLARGFEYIGGEGVNIDLGGYGYKAGKAVLRDV
jgi:hypothetical protein